jgi:DNA-binding response OmpR family regulator
MQVLRFDWAQQRNLSSVVIIFTANESLEDQVRGLEIQGLGTTYPKPAHR